MKNRTAATAVKVFAAILAFSTLATQLRAEDSLEARVQASVQKVDAILPKLRIRSSDLTTFPRWKYAHTLSSVETILKFPVRAPIQVAEWNESLTLDHTPKALALFISQQLSSGKMTPPPPSVASAYPELAKLPTELKNPVQNLLRAIETASPLVKKSVSALAYEDRKKILEEYDFLERAGGATKLRTPRIRKETFKILESWDQNAMVQASAVLLAAMDLEIPEIEKAAANFSTATVKAALPIKFKTAAGDVWITGKGDENFDLADLDSTAFYLKLGGNSHYEGRPMRQMNGQVRIGIDFSQNITVVSSETKAGFAAGIFGIDLFAMPNSSGTKTITTGSYAQGFGLCGTGGLFVKGNGTFIGTRYIQGVGIFGLGAFTNDQGTEARYRTQLYGQGVGFTRGIGLFIHQGSNAILQAGLVDPDPREPLGATSLSQGVGYGPRGYAGGGLGLCLLRGDGISVESSYFAQGAGYWRAAGSFYLQGNSSRIKARRYDQGSGVHSAAGFFMLKGNDNKVVNWGVGPAYGWDASIGWAISYGDRNAFQTEWGAATASLGASRSFSVFSGNDNQIDLPGLAGGQYIRDASDHAVSVLEGTGHKLKAAAVKSAPTVSGFLYTSPWGVISVSSATLVKDFPLEKQTWERLPQEAVSGGTSVNLEQVISAAEALPARDKVEQWLQVAACFSTDKVQPKRALAKLLALKPDELPYLLAALDMADVDGMIQIKTASSIWGDAFFNRIAEEYKQETAPDRKALLLSMYTVSKIGVAVPLLFRTLQTEPNAKLQSTAVRVLGALFNSNRGNISGRIYILQLLAKYLKSPSDNAKDELIQELTNIPYADAAGILTCAAGSWPAFDRTKVLESAPADITSPMDANGITKILNLLLDRPEESLKNVRGELLDAQKLSGPLRDNLYTILKKSRPKGQLDLRLEPEIEGLMQDVLTAYGKIGEEGDLERIAVYLEHSSGKLAEAAAISAARIGGAGKTTLENASQSLDMNVRKNAVAAISETSDRNVFRLFEKALSDENPEIQQVALSAIERTQRPLNGEKEKLKEKILRSGWKKKSAQAETERLFLFGD